jgi:hypothetical protein
VWDRGTRCDAHSAGLARLRRQVGGGLHAGSQNRNFRLDVGSRMGHGGYVYGLEHERGNAFDRIPPMVLSVCASKGPRMDAMSPPLQGLNPLNPIAPQLTKTFKLRRPESWLRTCQMTHISSPPPSNPMQKSRQVSLPLVTYLAWASARGLRWAKLVTAPLAGAPPEGLLRPIG